MPAPDRSTRRLARGASWILAAVVVSVGLGALAFGSVLYTRAEATRAWPTVEGVVLESGIARERASDGELRSTVAGEVVYTYVVEDTTYIGDRITWIPYATNDVGITRDLQARYPAGAVVPVHHDPDDPGSSVLEPGGGWAPWFLIGIGGVFALLGVAVAPVWRRRA